MHTRTLSLLILGLTPAPALAAGLEPLGEEALSEQTVEVEDVVSRESAAAYRIEEVERQQRELPDPPMAPEPGLPPPEPPPPLLPYQQQFLNEIIDGARDTATSVPR